MQTTDPRLPTLHVFVVNVPLECVPLKCLEYSTPVLLPFMLLLRMGTIVTNSKLRKKREHGHNRFNRIGKKINDNNCQAVK